ncbi:MAG: polyphosphate polymerase domain-containing protein [Lachnospiraceae bacterium]|nr:polyphosphate polymerase domain-containing protein [Lachnospiraceae bacterium]
MNTPRYRHELKYEISYAEMEFLQRRLKGLLTPDPHAVNGVYLVRSLYFDDLFGSAYEEKLSGISKRRKYRLRIYDGKDAPIFLECKHKRENYIFKESALLTKEEAEAFLRGEYTFLLNRGEPVCREAALAVLLSGLQPIVIVDYDRMPLVMEEGTVRITFDMRVRGCFASTDLFAADPAPFYQVLPEDRLILEVKYTEFLPRILSELLAGTNACQLAASKFVLCEDVRRTHLGLEVIV